MIIRKIMMTTAALALLTPLIAATPSFAEGRGFARSTAAGIAASPRGMANVATGGGMRVGGGGGWNHGGVAMGNGGGWHGGNGGGGGWHGGHHGGFFPGAVAGAVIGGAIANSNAYYGGGPGYYDQQYGYYDQPDYYDQGPVVAVAPDDGDSAGYCAQRYRSYDPGSGTYLGYDGLRHPCP